MTPTTKEEMIERAMELADSIARNKWWEGATDRGGDKVGADISMHAAESARIVLREYLTSIIPDTRDAASSSEPVAEIVKANGAAICYLKDAGKHLPNGEHPLYTHPLPPAASPVAGSEHWPILLAILRPAIATGQPAVLHHAIRLAEVLDGDERATLVDLLTRGPQTFVPVVAASPPLPEAGVHELLNIGQQFSNVAFNWSQNEGRALNAADCAMLKKLQREWDSAARILRASLSGAKGEQQ